MRVSCPRRLALSQLPGPLSPCVSVPRASSVRVVIDHLGLSTTNAEASARPLAETVGLKLPLPMVPTGTLYNVPLSGAGSLTNESEPVVPSHHVAFGVGDSEFAAIVDRLRQRGISFGNDPEQPTNGATEDPAGGKGRVFPKCGRPFLEVTVQTVN
jgi:hypothetical protein